MKNIQEWFKKISVDSANKAITTIISNILIFLIFSFFTISVTFLSLSLQTTIQVPLVLIYILSFFALIGVLIPGKKIFGLISKNKNPSNHLLGKVSFEDTPRERRIRLHFDGLEWRINSMNWPDVFCSIHNILLPRKRISIRYEEYIISICPDCEKGNNNYYKEGDFKNHIGVAFHCLASQEKDFLGEVQHRLVREASKY